jgi:hypothetical protein
LNRLTADLLQRVHASDAGDAAPVLDEKLAWNALRLRWRLEIGGLLCRHRHRPESSNNYPNY